MPRSSPRTPSSASSCSPRSAAPLSCIDFKTMEFSHDTKLNELAEKVEAGVRLSFEDGLALFATEDVPALGRLADTVRRRLHGRVTYYNVNRHFNPTNICYAD